MNESPLRTVIVGLGGIANQHLRAIGGDPAFTLAAVCDLDEERLARRVAETGAEGFADLDEMLRQIRPEVAVIATDNASHAALTLRCCEHESVRAIHCEKPMAVHPGDARAMVRTCEARGILLTVNHQRRMGDLAEARRFLKAGEAGKPIELRGFCAGDLLSDGTHLIDGLMALLGDPPIQSIDASMRIGERRAQRYGHAVEAAAHVRLELEDGPFCQVQTGTWAKGRAYQEMHVLCEYGHLWRTGDRTRPNWFLCDGSQGDHIAGFDRGIWAPRPIPSAGGGPWREAPFAPKTSAPAAVYKAIAENLRSGAAHPLAGRRSLQTHTALCGAYASALGETPLTWEEAGRLERFPLVDTPHPTTC